MVARKVSESNAGNFLLATGELIFNNYSPAEKSNIHKTARRYDFQKVSYFAQQFERMMLDSKGFTCGGHHCR
jgi:hypothetical protein